MPSLRSLLTYSTALVVLFLVAFAIGYVYNHDPERDLVEVVIDRSALPEGDGDLLSGTILTIDGETIRVATTEGARDLELSDVRFEELRPLDDPSDVAAGVMLNLGGERTPVERVISGVVLIAPEVTP